MNIRRQIANWIRGRDAVVVRMPIGFGEIQSMHIHGAAAQTEKVKRVPSVTLYPGTSVDLFIGDQFVMKIEPVQIADQVFGIQIVECRPIQ